MLPTVPIRPRTRTPRCDPSDEAGDGDGLAPSVQDPHRPPGQPGQASSEVHLTPLPRSPRGACPRRRDSTTSSRTRQTHRSKIDSKRPSDGNKAPARRRLQRGAQGSSTCDAPGTTPSSSPAARPASRVHDGVPVHRFPSRMFPKIASLPLGIPKPRIVRLMRRRLAGSAPLGGSSRPSAVSPQQILRHRVTTNFTNGVTCGYSTLPTFSRGSKR